MAAHNDGEFVIALGCSSASAVSKEANRLSHVSPGDHSKFTLTRCSYDLPAPTLTVFGQQPNGMTGVIHPEYDRKFTIPELKRLFGLPDDYALTGTLGQGAERILWMVPPS